jgi:hypothetical protein
MLGAVFSQNKERKKRRQTDILEHGDFNKVKH